MKRLLQTAVMLAVVSTQGTVAKAADFRSVSERSPVQRKGCLPGEKWSISGTNPGWLNRFHDFVTGKSSALGGFADAVSLKRISALLNRSDFERDFSEYWVGRILFDLKLDPIAHQVFKSVLENSEQKEIRKAAFVCMAQIERRSPDYKVPADSVEWGAFNLTEEDADVIYTASLIRPTKLTALLPSGYRDFYNGVNAMKNRKYSDAHAHLTKFIAFLDTPKIVTSLEQYRDQANIMLGRALYSTAHFKEATAQFQKVKKTSNLQIETLSNLSWAYLLQEEYDAAIGVSMQLRTGSLRNTFAPEPLMVAAMALNELCMYQDSIRTIQAFINDYGKSFEWLHQNEKNPEIYAELLKHFRKQSTVPTKVATEWMRSPAFLVRQEELNRLIEHPKRLVEIRSKGYSEQVKVTNDFLLKTAKFLNDVKLAKAKKVAGEDFSDKLNGQYLTMKRDLRRLTRFYRASKIWKNLAHNYEKQIPAQRVRLVGLINKDLTAVNKQMLTALQNVRENSDWIEVEIYNGASQDLVWKDAHPDYEKVSAEIEETVAEEASGSTWKWGRFLASEMELAEVWEDEVGALKADISNQCDKKDRYLKLKINRRKK
jgi:tetratricopeptide (TPR) repeat protein